MLQDSMLKFPPIRKNGQLVIQGQHYSLYPTEDMLLTDFESKVLQTRHMMCDFKAEAAPVDIPDPSWPTDLRMCNVVVALNILSETYDEPIQHYWHGHTVTTLALQTWHTMNYLETQEYCRPLQQLQWSSDRNLRQFGKLICAMISRQTLAQFWDTPLFCMEMRYDAVSFMYTSYGKMSMMKLHRHMDSGFRRRISGALGV